MTNTSVGNSVLTLGVDWILAANLGNQHGLERWLVRTAGGAEFTTLPLGKVSLVAIKNTRAYIGTADSFAIDGYPLNGWHTGVIRKAIDAHATTAADIERYKSRDTLGELADRIEYKKKEWQTTKFRARCSCTRR